MVWKGIDSPWEILASRLSNVVILGAAITLLNPNNSPADSRMSRAKSPPSFPNVHPIDGTAGNPPTCAGKLTKKFRSIVLLPVPAIWLNGPVRFESAKKSVGVRFPAWNPH